MKIFMGFSDLWEKKVNFIDENNVMLGYDLAQACCEAADWFISDEPTEEILNRDAVVDVKDFVFDPEYFCEVNGSGNYDLSSEYDELDHGTMAIFRLVNGDQEKFLHIYNCHNGYYGHGFEFAVGTKIKHEGLL